MSKNTGKPQLKPGDFVRIVKIPPDLNDSAGIDTPGVFARALGGTFRIKGIEEHGHLEIVVTESDTIYIEPEFVEAVSGRQTKVSRKKSAGG